MATGRLPDPNSSPLTAKGDLYTYSTVPAKLAVGNNGETLVADSSATTGLRWQGSMAGGRNIVINGGMDIWQRGTSFTGSGTAFGPDRWQAYRSTTGSTFSRQNTSDTTNLPFVQYCVRASRDSGNTATNNIACFTNLESVNSIPLAGKTITLSFYARRGANFSAASNIMVNEIYQGTGTDQNILSGYTNQSILSQNNTLTTTWQRFTQTITASSTTTQFGFNFYFTPAGTAGAADYFEITGIQVEVGSVPTQFSRAGGNIAGELAACQRYYFRNTGGTAYSPYSTGGFAASATSVYFSTPYPVQMRVAPTSVDYSTLRVSDGTNATAVSSISLDVQTSPYYANIGITVASGLTQYRGYTLQGNNSTSAYLGFSAEL